MKKILLTTAATLVALIAGARTYLATDKACYLAGEKMFCSAFSDSPQSVVYLELRSADGVAARGRIALDSGRGGGELPIPPMTPTGNYSLLAFCKGEEPEGSAVISVFNTFTTARVTDGVEVLDHMETPASVQTGYGLSASEKDGELVLENISGHPLSLCVALRRDDSLQEAAYHSIASAAPIKRSGHAFRGEVVEARMTGRDMGTLPGPEEIDAVLAVPGSKTDCCTAAPSADGSVEFRTENIYGDVDVVCMLRGLPEGTDCHLELVSPFKGGVSQGLPKLRICRSQQEDLERRSAALTDDAASDSLLVSLPVPREHFFLSHECRSYILDDYVRFPTMEELFVEITYNIRMRKRGGKHHVYLLKTTPVSEDNPRQGEALLMIDGVPVPDAELIATYDPALIKVVETYPYDYTLGGRTFDGVINFVTFKGDMPGVLFDDNVRIYSFQGCSLPRVHSDSETLWWHPLLTLAPGEKITVPSAGKAPGARYMLSAEGLDENGNAVWLRKSFSF